MRVKVNAALKLQGAWRRHCRSELLRRRAQQHAALESRAKSIQAQYRAHQRRSVFLRVRGSATVAQRVWRGSSVRERLSIKIIAARKLQTAWHRHCVRQGLRRAQLAEFEARATSIQAQYRAHQRRSMFQHQRGSAVVAQRVWRGSVGRRRLRMEIHAARKLQLVWRRHREQQELRREQQHEAFEARATAIQARYRAHRRRSLFLCLNSSAAVAQRVWRGCVARKRLRMEIRAARKLQAAWRRHCVHQALRRAQHFAACATSIQARYRAYQHTCDFFHSRRSAVVAQRVWRGSTARRQLRMKIHAARKLQAAWRHYCEQQQQRRAQQHATLTARVTSIQARYRAHRRRSVFLRLRGSAVDAQRVWRGYLTRRRHSKEIRSAQKIQTAWHRHRVIRQQHAAVKTRAISIQAQYRAYRHKREFLHLKGSAAVAQRVWRGSAARRQLRVKVNAARKLQAAWRRHRHCAQQHEATEARATSIQAQYRAYRRRSVFLHHRGNAVVAQRLWRGCVARRQLRRKIHAARKLQAAWRRHREQQQLQRAQQYAALEALATSIQAQYRALQQKSLFARLRRSVVVAQRVWRGCAARSRLRMEMHATLKLQTVWRRHRAHEEMQRAQHHAVLVAWATLIQAQYRAHRYRSVFLQQKAVAVFAQRVWRGILARNRLRRIKSSIDDLKSLSAIAIQRNWRRFCFESRYFSILMAVLAIQSWFRQIRCTRMVVEGVRRLQAATRGAQSRRLLIRVQSACIIENWWRCHRAMVLLEQRRYDAIRIQAVARSWLKRRYMTRYLSSVIHVQACFRSYHAKIEIARFACSARSIQCLWRSHIARSRFLKERSSAIFLQRSARMAVSRKAYFVKQSAALVVQYHWRRRCFSRGHEHLIRCAILVQRTVRSYLARQSYLKVKRGVCLLQALIRGALKRATLKEWRTLFESTFDLGEKSTKAAISIQSVTRRKFERDKFGNLRDAAVRVQKHQRMRYARNLMNSRKRQHLLVLASFQAIVRAKLARCLFARQKSAANVIQRAFFTWKMNVTLLEVQSSVVLLKRSIRGQLERSATRFALSHVNDSRRSFDRISTLSFHVDSSILAAWSEAESMAKECAAVVIQGAVRRYIAIVHIREMVDKSHGEKINSKIGARWRIILLRQDANATIIQSRFRAFRKRRELSLENFHAAATLLQATYRCHWHRREFFRAQTSAIKLQYHFRELLSRMSAAALIQASVRGYQCRMHYHSSVESVRVIQSYWRRHVHSIRKSKALASAIRIQKWGKAVKRRLMERKELALATARGVHFVEEAILLEMERKARDQVGLLLLKPRRVRRTSACVRRLAKRVKSLSEDCKENRTHGESNNAGLFTVYEQDVYASAPM